MNRGQYILVGILLIVAFIFGNILGSENYFALVPDEYTINNKENHQTVAEMSNDLVENHKNILNDLSLDGLFSDLSDEVVNELKEYDGKYWNNNLLESDLQRIMNERYPNNSVTSRRYYADRGNKENLHEKYLILCDYGLEYGNYFNYDFGLEYLSSDYNEEDVFSNFYFAMRPYTASLFSSSDVLDYYTIYAKRDDWKPLYSDMIDGKTVHGISIVVTPSETIDSNNQLLLVKRFTVDEVEEAINKLIEE